MNRIQTFMAAGVLSMAALAVSAADQAAAMDKAASAVTGMKHKLQAVALCDACGTVESTRMERRKGKASGMGAIGGAVAGGVIGNKTTDSTVGTVGGAAVGGLLGNEIEKRAKRSKVWITTVKMKDGSTRDFESASDPKWAAGTVVEVGADNQLKKH
jgi:outer membrane lipoprotein SlyB